MAEMEIRRIKPSKETLNGPQLEYLRRYHATSLICDVMLEVGCDMHFVSKEQNPNDEDRPKKCVLKTENIYTQ